MVRALVTGAAGFIGSNLARRLAADGQDVVAADSFLSSSWETLADFPGDVLTLRDSADLASIAALGPFDVVYHQASITGVVDTKTGAGIAADGGFVHSMMRNNVEFFRGLLDHAAETGARVVWASSCSVYGRGEVPMREEQPYDPLNVYAFSKVCMERMAGRYRDRLAHPIVGLRYSNVYGPGEAHKGKLASMVHQLAVQMRAGRRPRVFTDGTQRRDLVYIDDVVDANLAAARATETGNFNVGAGESWSFNELIAELNRVLGQDLQPDYFDNPYGFTQDVTQTSLDNARRALGYRPKFDLRSGVDAYHASGKLSVAPAP